MRMIAFGDSVVWGQGLLAPHKFSSLVYEKLNAGPPPVPGDFQSFAHSGAIIGVGATTTNSPLDGEVPDSYPTILQQIAAFDDHPETADLVIVNGGINDLDVRTIISPLTDIQDLQDKITQYCYQDMMFLLGQVSAKFTSATTRIIVTSYFPILSAKSDPLRLPKLLSLHGIDIDPLVTAIGGFVFNKILRQCQMFFDRSNASLLAAVSAANANGGAGRIAFAEVPFTDDNCVFAPQAWLWGLADDLSPEDEVAGTRHQSCDIDESDIIRRLTCYRASAGHPNLEGAAQFATAIEKVY
jgi:hypothetical protein